MISQATTEKCPVCDSSDLSRCAEIKGIPVFCNVLLSERPKALGAKKGDLRLELCGQCGHVHNSAFEPDLVKYTDDYDCSLHYSTSFQSFAEQLAEQLVTRYRLNNKTVIEIACGKGDFISLLCTLGNNKGIGFDPSYKASDSTQQPSSNFEIIKDYFSPKYGDLDADFICCRHAIEHVANPVAFLETIRRAINGKTGVALYFEVPDMNYTFNEVAIWDLIYEHCGYFCKTSCEEAFTKSGFKMNRIATVFGNQYLAIEVEPEQAFEKNSHQSASDGVLVSGSASVFDLDRYLESASHFNISYRSKLGDWSKRLSDFKDENLKVVVWGCGSKGVTFLNILNVDDEVSYVVDINPNKCGKFTAGTGHEVVSPDFLKHYQPHIVIVMNPLYKNEIQRDISKLNIKPEVITA
ncbi:class I SAM-dependent methyltransferase [Alkalimarinus coralli]|uniref:class I SAM-dependent methyltransferase n=1 Tax=Alkalimarinus coralli TaxID=2935863 RepID=UPI00202B4C9D|nr:class I SAM-dependent methyltransferase [Alkalimarinus coralli]